MSQEPEFETPTGGSFRLADWLVEPSLNRLSRGDTTIQLELKVMDVLVCLAERAGEVVPRHEIVDTVWATEFIADNTLTHAVTEIRNAFGDDARDPSFIETIHRRGYRLIASVEAEVSDEPAISRVARFPVPERAIEDDRIPYPGLAAFTEADAEFFFGREAEVAQLWRKITTRRLLAVIGPSGVGKSSFLRAGVIPAAPRSWGILVCQPGEAPFGSLARALAPEFAGDAEAVEGLVGMANPDTAVAMVSRWRDRHEHMLLLVDQFEELFTQNSPEAQASFAGFLRKLVDSSDVHVLLSMRDDFLHRCHHHEALAPVFDSLTPVKTPAGEALRRALVEPAKKQGFGFDDDDLPGEMVAEVEGERGALPMLAFAVARLWEKRDTERNELTRSAYQDIGGVSGGLAQHAESTLTAIGKERLRIVREIFRNLVTAEGTRAVRGADDLLSVFEEPQREDARAVLHHLINARLLTSFDEEGDESEIRHHRVEVMHESLLTSWPRAVGWQTQDADGARFRDELRQAARMWEEHGRHRDRLWSGAAYREFVVWRDRYPGGLTETEKAFAEAMTIHAGRRRRRRRFAAAAVVIGLSIVLGIVAVSRQQAVTEARRAEAETNRAEASKLLTLGEFAIEEERTEALAYAIGALELADTPEARRLALKALWAGPPATVLPERWGAWSLAFSRDTRHLAVGYWNGLVRVFPRDGGAPTDLEGLNGKGATSPLFSPDSQMVVAGAGDARGEVIVWATEGGPPLRTIQTIDSKSPYDLAYGLFEHDGAAVLTVAFEHDDSSPVTAVNRRGRYLFQRWPLGSGDPQILGVLASTRVPFPIPDLERGLIVNGDRDELHLHRLGSLSADSPRVIARYPEVFAVNSRAAFDPTIDRIAASDAAGNLWLWPLDGNGSQPERKLKAPGASLSTAFSPDGSLLAHASDGGSLVWDLQGPSGADPLRFTGPGFSAVAFTADGRWLSTSGGGSGLALWPLSNKYCRTLRIHEGNVKAVAFAPDGSRLFTLGRNDGKVLSVSLTGGAGLEPEVMLQMERQWGWDLEVDDRGRFLIVSGTGEVWKIPTNGTAPSRVEGLDWFKAGDLDPSGRLLAGPVPSDKPTPIVIVIDLDSGERRELAEPGTGRASTPVFDPTGRMLVARGGLLSRWDPATDVTETLIAEGVGAFELSPDGRSALVWSDGSFFLADFEQQQRTEIAYPAEAEWFEFDSSGELLIVGTDDGEVQVGPISGGEPHLLLGHQGKIHDSEVSPDGHWIALAGDDGIVRLCPMPDLSKPPLHTLPHDELLAKLKTLTNLRAVPDDESYIGYLIEPDFTAYRGWETVPTW